MNIPDKIENYESYWDLVNSIDDLCCESIEKGHLYGDDIISALDRVKMNVFEEYLSSRYNLQLDKKLEEGEKGEET